MADRSVLKPQEIEARSFEIIDRMLAEMDQSGEEWPVIRRMVHASGDPSIAHVVRWSTGAVRAGVDALAGGAAIVVDVRMALAGVSAGLASRLGSTVLCALDEPGTDELARESGITRSAAAIRTLGSRLSGGVVAIGNAPTALYALMDLLDEGMDPPALVIAMPVGFVGAAESKEEFVQRFGERVPFISVEGTRGGTPLAVAAVNALLRKAIGAPRDRGSR